MEDTTPAFHVAELTPGVDGSADEHSTAWGVSLAFWGCLLVSAALYGMVALSPKLMTWLQVQHQYASNAAQLARLDANVEYLERVTDALQHDPGFAQRLAAASIPGTKTDDVLPVSRSLLFGSGDENADPPSGKLTLPPGTSLVAGMANNSRLRTLTLAIATLLTVFGFTFLNDSDARWLKQIGRGALGVTAMMTNRYRRTNTATDQSVADSDSGGLRLSATSDSPNGCMTAENPDEHEQD
jgi:hypothetical protein